MGVFGSSPKKIPAELHNSGVKQKYMGWEEFVAFE